MKLLDFGLTNFFSFFPSKKTNTGRKTEKGEEPGGGGLKENDEMNSKIKCQARKF